MAEPDISRGLLLIHLDAAVPLLLLAARVDGGTRLRSRSAEDADIIACGFDVLVRADEAWRKGDTAPAPHQLAKGLACAAYQPGGVRFAGLSWCAAHPRRRWTDGPICPQCLSEEIEAKAVAGG